MDDGRGRRLAFLARITIAISTAFWFVVLAAILRPVDGRSSSDGAAGPRSALIAQARTAGASAGRSADGVQLTR